MSSLLFKEFRYSVITEWEMWLSFGKVHSSAKATTVLQQGTVLHTVDDG